MKNLKLIYVSILIALFTLSSCTSDEAIVKETKTTQSVSARTALTELKTHFDENGALRASNNPTGNILFDYCFDFEFPMTFSYNTGATVVVNDFEGMIDILVNMTDTLYVDGVVFPFNVIVYDQDTDAYVVQVINNESEFETLVDSCEFDQDDYVCTDDFNPVCIEITDVNGETFTMQFPNMCIAEYEGFTQNDVVDCEDIVGPGNESDDCFELVYPISIVDYAGNTLTIESEDDWEIVLYTMNGTFDFVYPFNVILTTDNSTFVITNIDAYYSMVDNCNGLVTGDCDISSLNVTVGDCNNDGTYSITIDFNHENAGNEYFDLYVRNGQSIGYYLLSDLPVTISNFNLSGSTEDYIKVAINDNNNCNEEFEWVAPDCVDNTPCWTFVFPVTIEVNGVATVVNNDGELAAIINNPNVQYMPVYPLDVTINGTTITVTDGDYFYSSEIGGWDNMCE